MNRTPIPAPMRPRPASQGENAIRIAQTFNAALTEDHRGHFEQAKSLYELVLRMDPSSLGALHNLAYLLFRQGERGQAERILRKTIKAHPRSAEAHNTLGLVLHTTARFREAVVCYQKAISLKADYALAHNNLGASLHELRRPEEAIPHYQRALALDQNYADAWRNLGFAWQATGRIEEARAAFKTAIAIAPSIPSLYHGLISCTQLPPGDPHLAAMETILPKADALPVSERILLHFALAKALDDVGQPERAAQHLLIGNMIKRRELAYDEGAMLDLLARIQATFTPPMMEAEKSTKEGREPRPLFIIGMPRSGTTLVEQILASHQAIVGGGELPALRRAIEETLGKGNYPEAIPTITSGNLHKIGERYLSALRALFPRATHVVDKMPFNFLYVGIISLALPQARIIHIRRDPADTCFSCFSLLFKGELPFAYNLSELGRYYRAYERLMAHWRTVLPAGAMLEVSYEALVTDLESEARRLVAYCGLEWDPACLSFDKTKRVVLTASAAQVRRPIYRSSIGRWRRYQFMLAPLLAAMERTEYKSQSCEREPEHRSSAHRL